MFGCLGSSQQAHDTEVIARTVTVLALAALAVIHVVDLPGTLGPDRLVGIGYFGIIVAAMLAGGALVIRSHWLVWAVAGGSPSSPWAATYRPALSGGFLGDHGDVGNWRCPLGIAALSVETLIILFAAGWAPHRRGSVHPRGPAPACPSTPRAADHAPTACTPVRPVPDGSRCARAPAQGRLRGGRAGVR